MDRYICGKCGVLVIEVPDDTSQEKVAELTEFHKCKQTDLDKMERRRNDRLPPKCEPIMTGYGKNFTPKHKAKIRG